MISSGASCYITDKQRGSFQELTKARRQLLHFILFYIFFLSQLRER